MLPASPFCQKSTGRLKPKRARSHITMLAPTWVKLWSLTIAARSEPSPL